MAETRKRSRGNGEGSIYYSESKKKWIAQYTTGRTPDGKQKRKTFYADTRKAVKKKLEDFIKADCQEVAKTDETIVSIITAAYDYKFSINIINANTYGRAKETTKRIESHYISKLPLQKITENDLCDFFKGITHYSNSVIKKIYAQISYAFEYGVNNGIIAKSPLTKDKFPVPKSEKKTKIVRALTIEEQRHFVEVLKEHPDTNFKAQMLISLFSGMRMGEINALSLSDVDMKNRTVTISKTVTRDENYKTVIGDTTKTYAGNRTIQMTDALYNVFDDYFSNYYTPNKLNILFYHNDNINYVSTNAVNSQFKRIVKKYSITDDNVNSHMLRHTFATRAIEAGVNAKTLQKILGHADITVTLNTYCDVFDKFEAQNNERLMTYFKEQNLV